MQSSTNFARALGERICLVAWMILMVANTVMVGLSVELVVFGIILSVYHVNLIDAGTLPFLAIGFAAALNFPLVAKLHGLGVTHLNFEVHESMLNTTSESWDTLILTFLDETSVRSNQLEKLIRAISEASSAAERQERRAEAKAWLIENGASLTEEDRETVLEHLSYLKLP
jgi:hypothetical protein